MPWAAHLRARTELRRLREAWTAAGLPREDLAALAAQVLAAPMPIGIGAAADRLGCSIATVRQRIRSGDLPARFGPTGAYLFTTADLDAYLASLTRPDLDRLPPTTRAVVAQLLTGGTQRQAARALGLSDNVVSECVRRAVTRAGGTVSRGCGADLVRALYRAPVDPG